MKKPFDMDELDATLKSLDEESKWNEEHRDRLKNRIFQDVEREEKRSNGNGIPYKYYFSLAGAALLLWILFAPILFQQIGGFPFGGDVTSGEGGAETVRVFAPFVTIGGLAFLSVLAVGSFLVWKNQWVNQLFWKSEGFGFLLPSVRSFVGTGFRILLLIYGLYLFFTHVDKVRFINESDLIYFVTLISFSGILIFGWKWLEKRISGYSFFYPVQLIGGLFIILFLSYQMFTTHFYSEEYLIETGIEKIEWHYQLGDPQLSDQEFNELVEDAFTNIMAITFISGREHFQVFEYVELLNLEIIELDRRYSQYDLIVEIESSRVDNGDLQGEKEVWSYTFKQEGGSFKIDGFWQISNFER
ncbi:MAG: hypothetical protein LRY73_02935 [Bacillus sp. (in: Bacteria)]|nr:hypothetical protein [Bacillus sp. (in: firmicutes)]